MIQVRCGKVTIFTVGLGQILSRNNAYYWRALLFRVAVSKRRLFAAVSNLP